MNTRPSWFVVGEGMLELTGAGLGPCRLGFGGDTLNVAIHLARYGLPVGYVSALGADPLSVELRQAWAAEGIDTRWVLTDPDRQAGLYAIRNDRDGERHFSYWRNDSAAKRTFALPQSKDLVDAVAQAEVLFYSLITLAILPPEGREQLLALCRQVRARGGKVAFDGNYRPRLWPSAAAARASLDLALAECDIGLPTLADEQSLAGRSDAVSVADHWQSRGAGEVVVKLGSQGCWAAGGVIPPPQQVKAVDTSGAGDAFDAGYLAGRMRGLAATEAALQGHRLAAWVVGRSGAIPPRDRDACYLTA